jgi:hypothetical protein
MKKNDLLNDLSQAIFKRPFITLKKKEMEFVRYQEDQYRQYQDWIRKKALEIMDKKKLSSREYKIIEEWFFKWIPLHIILQGMEACLENSRGTGRAIYSLAFFKAHIIASFRCYIRRMNGGRFFADPWGYYAWLAKK